MKFKMNFVSKLRHCGLQREGFLMFHMPGSSSASIRMDASCQMSILAVVGYYITIA